MSEPTLPPSSDPTPPPAATPVSYATPGPLATDPAARSWAMVGHLSAFATFVLPSFGNIIGPLVVWLVKKDELPFAGDQAKEALNFNITCSIVVWVLLASMYLCIGFVLVPIFIPIVAVAWLVLTIIAAMKANEGIAYRYPLTLRLVK